MQVKEAGPDSTAGAVLLTFIDPLSSLPPPSLYPFFRPWCSKTSVLTLSSLAS